MTQTKKQLGQYFTVSDDLQQFVFDSVKHKHHCLLEPSFGAGHLLRKFKALNDNYPMVCYELDSSIEPILSFNDHQTVIYADFIKQSISQRFKTIIGNPPYVKQTSGNLYIQFIERCYECLDDDGELIFIVPSDFIKQTRASAIIETMTNTGSFTDFLFPHNEKLFEGASIDIVIFRYEKGLHTNTAMVNGHPVFCNVHNGILTFSDSERSGCPVESLFNVYVGLVSGRDVIYRVPFGNIHVLNDKDTIQTYIFTETFPTDNPEINAHLLHHKPELLERKIKKFTDKNWFEWGAPRNISKMQQHWGKPCIYVRTITRQKEVAFIDTVQYFGGLLLCLVPKTPMTHEALQSIVQFLNSPSFQCDYTYAGRFKIGHKQLSSAMLPT